MNEIDMVKTFVLGFALIIMGIGFYSLYVKDYLIAFVTIFGGIIAIIIACVINQASEE